MFRWITSRNLKSAWSGIDANPRQARPTLEGIGKNSEAAVQKAEAKGKHPKPADLATTIQAWLGVQLCDILLGKWEDAAKAEKRWRKHGEPSPEDIVKLARTWLQESPDPLPDSAVRAYGSYFALSETHQEPQLTEKLREYLEQQLSLPDNPSEDQTRQAIAWANLLYEQAPDVDWIQFQYGVSRFQDGDWELAAMVLTQAVKSSPRNPEWLTWQGRAEWRNGRRVIGRRALLEADKLAPTPKTAEEAGRACTQSINDPFSERDGEQYLGKNPGEVGISLLLFATEEAPESASAWLALARGHVELKQYDKALQAIERLILLKPDEVEAYCVRGEALRAQDKRAEAREALAYAQGISADSPVVARLAGDLAYDDGDYRVALDQYVKCPLSDWSDTELRKRLARCHLEAGKPEDVLKVATANDMNHAELRLTRGRAQARLERWDEALKTLETADWRMIGDEYRYYMATALAANQRFDESESVLNELCDVATWRDRARRQLGHIALSQNDDQTAEEFYVGEKNRAVTHEDLGRLLLVRGKLSAASTHFAKAGGANGAKPAEGSSVARLGYAFSECLRGNAAPAEDLTNDAELGPWAHEFRGQVLWGKHQYVEALAAYEQALQHRDHVPTQMLSRLAEGYLQLSRFRDALPHLVELVRRRPDNKKVALNLAYCRYHLGRKLFRNGSWEMARAEWQRVRKVLEPVNPVLAEAVGRWETEAAWRQVSDVLQHERWAELPRILELINTYGDRDAETGRWVLAEGLAHAFSKNHQAAAEAFQRSVAALPDHPSVNLGLGLSLQSSGQSDAAQQAFGKVLALTHDDKQQFLHVASRFSAAMSHAEAKQWKAAATVLEPVIGHELLRQSGRISDTDVAQAVVAYYGLAGETQKTQELAGKYLKGGGTIGDILIGIVQADSGDYEGAAQRLSRAYKQEENPSVRKVLVSCFVCLAAECILAGKLEEAEEHCKRALKGDRGHKTARRLLDAIVFAGNLSNLNMDQLDKAIGLCEPLVKTSKSVQLVRTLAILYHRHTIGEESRGNKVPKDWGRCVLFWTNEIISSDKFWEDFCEDFNEGRSRREQIKPDALHKLRSGLRNKMAKLHTEYFRLALETDSKSSCELHLRLIWEWDPEFEFTDEHMNLIRQKVEAHTAGKYRKVAEGIQDQRARNILTKELRLPELVHKANTASEKFGKLASGGTINPWDADKARRYLRDARDALEEAHNLAPDRPDIAESYQQIKAACLRLGA